ncbi:MAG: sel1 repeat family protein, partial [Mesorhizobium sp.]
MNNPVAQYNLGPMYADGEGVVEDDGEAVRWYRRAAGQDYAPSQYQLGVMYDSGMASSGMTPKFSTAAGSPERIGSSSP